MKGHRLVTILRFRQGPIVDAVGVLRQLQEEGATHATITVAWYEKREPKAKTAPIRESATPNRKRLNGTPGTVRHFPSST